MRWYGNVLSREYFLVLRRALDFWIEGQRRMSWPTWKMQVEEECIKVGLSTLMMMHFAE